MRGYFTGHHIWPARHRGHSPVSTKATERSTARRAQQLSCRAATEQPSRASNVSTTNRVPEVRPGAHALSAREQRLRQTAWRGPCGGDLRGSRGRPGCAYGGGNRASSSDGGGSAEKYACSRLRPLVRAGLENLQRAGENRLYALRKAASVTAVSTFPQGSKPT